jgi:hypothetical protein
MTRRWRLVGGDELYDIKADPGQKNDVASDYPDVVRRLRLAHERWWEEISPRLTEYCPISIGSEEENPTRLNSMDVLGDVAWNQGHIIKAQKSTGTWSILVEQPGTYTFRLRRWPEELDLPLDSELPEDEAEKVPYTVGTDSTPIEPVTARLELFGEEKTVEVHPQEKEVTFTLELDRTGKTRLEAWFADEKGEERGAYYVYVERQ